MLKMKCILIVLILFCVNCSAQKDDAIKKIHPFSSFDSLMVSSLSKKKVVLLGDSYHGHRAFYNIVIQSLNAWLNSIMKERNNENIPHNLLLCLEEGDEIIKSLFNKYLNNNNNFPEIKYTLSGAFGTPEIKSCSVDRFDFYNNLKNILMKIDSVNRFYKVNNYSLKIVGVEATPPVRMEECDRIGSEKFNDILNDWLCYVRDQQICKNIIKALEDNSGYKAIVYYGTGHLYRELVDMSQKYQTTNKNPLWNYVLARYLDNEYGRDNVDVYDTDIVHGRGNVVREFYKRNEHPDFSIYYDSTPHYPFPLWVIKNENSFKALIELMDESAKKDNEYCKSLFITQYRKYISDIERSYLLKDNANKVLFDSLTNIFKKKRASSIPNIYKEVRPYMVKLAYSFDIVKDIMSMGEWLLDEKRMMNKHHDIKSLKSFLNNLPIIISEVEYYKNLTYNDGTEGLTANEIETVIKRIGELNIYYAVSSLWINSAQENKKVIAYLQSITKQNFETIEEWNKWWYSKYAKMD